MSSDFPKDYPLKLIPCSWSINGKFGIMPRYTKYCKGVKKESNYFIQNYLENYFVNDLSRLGIDLVNYVDYIVSCFGVIWDEDQDCFRISIKRCKDNLKKPIFDNKKFYELSKHIELDTHKEADNHLKKTLNNMLKFYNAQIKL